MTDEALKRVERVAREGWRAPKNLSLSQWSDEYAVLSAESSHEAGKFKCLPTQRGIMDAITDAGIEQVTVMKSARVGYTKVLNNAVGYFIHQDPCPILVVQPTLEDADGYSKEEIAPMLRDTPCLVGRVTEAKAKAGDNTIRHKIFPGGVLSLVGANSPRGFRRISRRVILLDEVDGYPITAGAEGDPFKLAVKRGEAFWNRKIVAGSTPTIKDQSRIEMLFKQSDQRRYFVPCPHCGTMQYLKWGGRDKKFGIKWPSGEALKAFYVCESCEKAIEHKWLRWMVERGGWRATAPGNGRHAGFHLWAAYSAAPNATWGHIAQEFLESKDNPDLLKTFVNTTLGETWEDAYSAKVGADALSERSEAYLLNVAPKRVLIAVASVDVQDNRIEIKVKGYCDGEESWLLNWLPIFGDPQLPDVWQQLDNVLETRLRHERGIENFPIRACGIDTGHHTHAVYNWVRQRTIKRNQGKSLCHVFAFKGSSIAKRPIIGRPRWMDINWKNQTIKRGVELWPVGTDTAKSTIYNRLKLTQEGPGFMHFPAGLPKEYFEQLTIEKQVRRYVNGFPQTTWIKPSGARNEALDLEVYALAALQCFYTRTNRATIWRQLEGKLPPLKPDDAKPPTDEPPLEPPPEPTGGKKLPTRPRRSWMRG